jgi:hypothetical protein
MREAREQQLKTHHMTSSHLKRLGFPILSKHMINQDQVARHGSGIIIKVTQGRV